jgi:hypothetical protein
LITSAKVNDTNYATGSGQYKAGDRVHITAPVALVGRTFSDWMAYDPDTKLFIACDLGSEFNNQSADTYIIMPAQNLTLFAAYT